MHIGLIGGIGPAATDFYYRRLISEFAKHKQSFDLTMVHAETKALLANQAANNVEAQVAIYRRLTERLVAAGAENVVVTSIAGHFCIEPFKDVSPLPVIDMIAEVSAEIERRGLQRVGILGTRVVMETRFYGGIRSADIVPPAGGALDAVHQAYVDMASAARATDAQKAVFDAACRQMLDVEKVDAVMLGGTDLALVYSEETAPFPLVDCAAIHADAIVTKALS